MTETATEQAKPTPANRQRGDPTKIKPWQWKPGQSGNPNGRPKVVKSLQAEARKHTDTAISTLVGICLDEKASQSARVAAASQILDRGYGKPSQKIGGEEGNPVQHVHKVVREVIIAGQLEETADILELEALEQSDTGELKP